MKPGWVCLNIPLYVPINCTLDMKHDDQPSIFLAPYFQPNQYLYEATTFGGRWSLLQSRGWRQCGSGTGDTVNSWLLTRRHRPQGMAACRASHGARGLHAEFRQRQLGFVGPSQPASNCSVIFQVLCGIHLTTLI